MSRGILLESLLLFTVQFSCIMYYYRNITCVCKQLDMPKKMIERREREVREKER